MLDNISGMILMAGLLVGTFGFPAGFVLTRMIPGTVVCVLVGDPIYTGMAVRLPEARRRQDQLDRRSFGRNQVIGARATLPWTGILESQGGSWHDDATKAQ
jgi:hypothetical protein